MKPIRPLATPLDRPLRLAVLISGGGTTLTNFLAKIAAGELHAEIPLVISSQLECGGFAKARQAGLNCEVICRRDHARVEDFSDALFARCRQANVDLVTLAGFLALIRV